jgi:hypothetical protein
MTALNRLNKARAEAAKWKEKQPTYTHYHNWRTHRRNSTHAPRFGFAPDGKYMWLDSHQDAPNIRHFAHADECARLNHREWFADDYQDETIRGTVTVMRLGKWAYIVAGVTYKESDCDALYWDSIEKMPAREAWDDRGDKTDALEQAMRDIAHQADSIAERTAEENREAWQKDQAEQAIEGLRDDITTARAAIRTLAKEIKAHGTFTPAVCTALSASIRKEWAQVQKWRKRIEDLTDRPYLISI